MIDLHQIIDQKIISLQSSMARTKHERDTSATYRDTNHDQSRSIAERFLGSLEVEYRKLEALKKQLLNLPSFHHQADINTLITIMTPSGNKDYLLVPDGLGGIKAGSIVLLSVSTPLASCFVGHSSGFKFSFNGETYVLVSVRPNC